MTNLPEITELSDAELDAVAGGHALAAGGLVNVAVNLEDIEILRNSFQNIDIDIIDDVTLQDIANNNKIGVGVLANVLGGPAFLLQRVG